MQWVDISETDRKVIRVMATFAALLLIGLMITGLWHFVVYRPQSEDIQLTTRGVVRLAGRPRNATSAHGFFADVAGMLTVFAGGWLTYHLLRRVSRTSIACLAVLVATIVGGEQLKVNILSLRDGAADGSTLVSDYEIIRLPEPLWTALHVVSVPVLLLIIWYSLRYRNPPRPEPEPRWKLNFD